MSAQQVNSVQRVIEAYSMLHIAEMEIAISHSKVSKIDKALRETEKHIQAAQASLKVALTFRPEPESESEEDTIKKAMEEK